jgi:CBS domain-containing protein
MNISDICKPGVKTCGPKDTLAAAAGIMWQEGCGAVPVVDENGRLVGIVTERDICVAVATRRRLASEIAVDQVMSGSLVSCRLEDPVKDALRLMREAQVRRLPVLGEGGTLIGTVSVKDILLAVREFPCKTSREALQQEIILTLMAISQHHSPNTLELAEPRAMIPGA